MRFNRSEPGMIFSSVAHAALFVVLFVGFSSAKQFADHEEAIPVDFVSESDLRQMTRGERDAKTVVANAQRKVDRAAENAERKQDAPLAQRDVEAPAGPPPSNEKAEAEAADKKAAEEKARADAEARAKVEAEVKAKAAAESAARAAEQAERARQAAAAAAEQARQDKARQEAAQKAAEEQERKEAEELRQRRAEEAKKAAAEKARREAEAQALHEKIAREKQEAEERKAAEAEKARKAAEAKRMADERAKKAAEEKAKREAEAKAAAARRQAEQKPFNPTDIATLLANKQPAQSTGSTGAQPQRQASLGSPTSSAPKLSPSDRESLIGYLQAKMRDCVSVPPGSNRNARPEIRVLLTRDGALAAPPALVGGDRAVGEAAVRGIRACAPYKIPDRFMAQYEEWRSMIITIDASDL